MGTSAVDAPYTTTGDIFRKAYLNQKYTSNIMSDNNAMDVARQEAIDALEIASGKPIKEFFDEGVLDPTIPWHEQWENWDNYVNQKRNEGVWGFNGVPTSDAIKSRSTEIFGDVREDFEETVARAEPEANVLLGSISGHAAAWLGDPIQGSLTILGGGIADKLSAGAQTARAFYLRLMAAEAGVEGSIEAVAQTHVKEWHEEAGYEYTWGDAATNVLIAATASGAISGVIARVSGAGRHLPKSVRRDALEVELTKDISTPPRDGDGVTQVAHEDNLRIGEAQMSEGRMPDPVSFRKESTPKKFLDDYITYDHVTVARHINTEVSAGRMNEVSARAYARDTFINELREELVIDAGKVVARDVEGEWTRSADAMTKARNKVYKIEDELEELSSKPITDKVLRTIDRKQVELEQAKGELAKSIKRNEFARSQFHANARAQQAADDLAELEAAPRAIPKRQKQRFENYKKNLAKAVNEEKSYRDRAVRLADDILEGRVKYPTASDVAAKSAEVSARKSEVQSSDYKKAKDTAWRSAGEAISKDRDLRTHDGIRYETGDGVVTGTYAEIDDLIKEDEALEQHLNACRIG